MKVGVNGNSGPMPSALESLQGPYGAQSQLLCPAEAQGHQNEPSRMADIIWIAGCMEGESSINILDEENDALWGRVCSRSLRSLWSPIPSFDIDLVFMDRHAVTSPSQTQDHP